MKKDTLGLKSLILPLILLFCLIGGRKYVYETGTNNLELLPIEGHRLGIVYNALDLEIGTLIYSSHQVFEKLQNIKNKDSIQIRNTCKKLHNEVESTYKLLSKTKKKLIEYTGGYNTIGHYIGAFKRVRCGTKATDELYHSLEALQFGFQADSLLDILQFNFQSAPLSLIIDDRGRQIDSYDFGELYDDAPLIILLLNLSRLEYRVAKLHYYSLLHIAQKYNI